MIHRLMHTERGVQSHTLGYRARCLGGGHLREHSIQPLQGTMEMDLYPAWCAGDVLSMVLRPPALHKAHSNGAHLGQSVNSLETLVHTLCQQLGKVLIVEYFEGAAGGYLADRGWVEMMGKVAVSTLYKQRPLTEALGKHLTAHVEQMNPSPDVLTYILNGGVTIHT